MMLLPRWFLEAILLLISALAFTNAAFIGVNIGTDLTNMPSPSDIVSLLKSHQITHVRLYDANSHMLKALSNTTIQVTVGVTNQEILKIGRFPSSAASWVNKNVAAYVPSTNITAIAVGSEVLTESPHVAPILASALNNIHKALVATNLNFQVKVSTPMSMDVMPKPFPPSTINSQVSKLKKQRKKMKLNMTLTKNSLILFLCFLSLYSVTVKSQNCGCAPNHCCSQFGYCGTNDAHCGAGCKSGPCKVTETPIGGGTAVSSIVTEQFFNDIIKNVGSGCAGKRFYTRDSFINAANTFSKFATSVTRREIATMFAHFTHATGHFCNIEVINGRSRKVQKKRNGRSRNDCDENPIQDDCSPGKDLQSPSELVGNPTVSFKTSLWFWMNSVRPVLNQGFGATIRAINGIECNGGNSDAVNERIRYYRYYCRQLGVDPGSHLSC